MFVETFPSLGRAGENADEEEVVLDGRRRDLGRAEQAVVGRVGGDKDLELVPDVGEQLVQDALRFRLFQDRVRGKKKKKKKSRVYSLAFCSF